MMRIIAAIGTALLGGCVTTGGGNVLMVNTDPQGALLTIDGIGECETPCSVKLDEPRQARIAKAGFVTLGVLLKPGSKPLTIPLDLAAASTDVDAEALPELK